MKARTRTAVSTLGLLAAAAGAITYAYFGVAKKDEAETQRKETEAKIFGFEASKVTKLTVSSGGDEVKLERTADGWSIVAPKKADADKATVDALVDKLAAAKKKSEVAPAGQDPKSLGQYGLAKPKTKIVGTLEDGKTESLAVGDDNGFDQSVYIQPTSGAVLLAGNDTKWPLEKNLFDLREKRLIAFEDKDVKKVEVVGPKLSYAFERDGEHWKLTAPLADRADTQVVDKILGAVRNLRANEFVKAPKADKEYGFDAPKWTVQLTGTDGALRTVSIGIVGGAPAPAPKPKQKGKAKNEPKTPPPVAVSPDYYARRGEGVNRDIAKISDVGVKDLDVDAFSLRDKLVLPLEREKVAIVKIKNGALDVEVTKSVKKTDAGAADESWSLARPKIAPAKRWKISGLLYGLSSVRATAFADESGKKLAEHGLDKPSQVITFLAEDGKELGKLEVGRELGDKVFVRSSASPRIWEIEKAKLSEVPKTIEDIEDKEEKPQAKAG